MGHLLIVSGSPDVLHSGTWNMCSGAAKSFKIQGSYLYSREKPSEVVAGQAVREV